MGKSLQKNFTLLELLISIAIIAILTSTLLPALAKAREKAFQISCMNNFRQTGIALLQYSNDFNGFLPFLLQSQDLTFTDTLIPYTNPAYAVRRPFSTTGTWAYFNKYASEQRIFSEKSIFVCPSAAALRKATPYYISNYEPTRCNDGMHNAWAWWGQKNSEIDVENPAARKLNSIKGRILVGEKCYTKTTFAGAIQISTPGERYILCTSIDPFLSNTGTVHSEKTGGNWLYKDGHVSYSRFSSFLIRNAACTVYFQGN